VLTFTDLSNAEPFPIDDLEFAIPYSKATSALRALSGHFNKTGKYPQFFPMHMRCSKRGSHWLSANHEQDVCWLEFWQYPSNPEFYATLHQVLKPYGYRPHWGKLSAAD